MIAGSAGSTGSAQPAHAVRVVVAGNPNAGKSTLFNALTGGSSQVGNFPGTTVGRTVGKTSLDGVGEVELVDVPGTFSLASSSPDERVAIDSLLGWSTHGPAARPDLVLLVADAPRLLRSLYLVLQVLELGVPVVLAVNLVDEAGREGISIRADALSAALGVPVVCTVARTRQGVPELRRTLAEALTHRGVPRPAHRWSPELEADVAEVARSLPATGADPLAVARWAVLSADPSGRLPGVVPGLDPHELTLPVIPAVRARARASGRDLDAELVEQRYAWIDSHEAQFLGRLAPPGVDWTHRVDRVVLHPVLGPALFVGVMALAFTALFSWADPLMGSVEAAFGWFGAGVASAFDAAATAAPGLAGALAIARDLTVDGVIGGVGGVVVFLPQIALLFLFLALLEDVGYLARAAHLADRLLRMAGLPGRAFVPVLSGYACAVPAILATRTLPRHRDRLLTMLVIPLTSCSARLPVYTLMIAALFPPVVAGFVPVRPIALAGMYLFSTALALGASVVLGNTVFRNREEAALLELPPYRIPDPRVVATVVWGRCRDFLREAGGLILAATLVIWAMLYFPRYEPQDLLPADVIAAHTDAEVAALAAPLALERSFAGRLGRTIEPAIAPLGYDWRIGIGLLGAFAAREVFVSTMGVVYGIGDDVTEDDPSLRERLRTDRRPDGSLTYTPLVGGSLLVFFAIALQCTSTLAVLRKESGTWTWPVLAFVWTLGLAWVSAFVVYQGGRALGFG
ncbi:MAG: ferrous iron transporter B [Myxococcota bacterium]